MVRFKLVPVEPTRKMINAGLVAADGEHSDTVADIPANAYRAMLQAAPEPTPEMVDRIFLAFRLHVDRMIPARVTDEDRANTMVFLKHIGEMQP